MSDLWYSGESRLNDPIYEEGETVLLEDGTEGIIEEVSPSKGGVQYTLQDGRIAEQNKQNAELYESLIYIEE